MCLLCVGTYTMDNAPAIKKNQKIGKGIYVGNYNACSSVISDMTLCAEIENPSWISVIESRIFAVNEIEKNSILMEFEWKRDLLGIHLNLLKKLKMQGSSSCHIEIDKLKKRLYLSNYGSGDLKIIDISQKGNPKLIQEISFEGKSINSYRQDKAHIHSSLLFENKLYVADLGTDHVYVFDTSKDRLEKQNTINCLQGSGPRHMVAWKNKNLDTMLYVVNELNCTISVFMEEELVQTVNLYDDKKEKIELLAADICLSTDNYLYVSVRGSGEIYVFSICSTGKIEKRQIISANGKGLRSICLDISQKFLLVADQESGCIESYLRIKNGKLQYNKKIADVPATVKIQMMR